MTEKINIAEILKDCSKGTKLYSPLCGECYFDRLNRGTIICKKQNTQEITFTSEGYYMIPVFNGAEPMLFPSKENRDWSKFQIPFKDGDILVSSLGNPFIFKELNGYNNIVVYCALNRYSDDNVVFDNDNWTEIAGCRFATEEEKEKLFDAIKAKGYKWNPETKTLEKLPEPRFKVGDIIKTIYKSYKYIIKGITDTHYTLEEVENKFQYTEPIIEDKNWELVPNKFDITTLKPFDKVLVRDENAGKWGISFFGFCNGLEKYKYSCINDAGYVQCIPYEGNEHLLGTTNDCDEFYKIW